MKKEDGGGGCMLYYQESLDATDNKLFPAELDTLELYCGLNLNYIRKDYYYLLCIDHKNMLTFMKL